MCAHLWLCAELLPFPRWSLMTLSVHKKRLQFEFSKLAARNEAIAHFGVKNYAFFCIHRIKTMGKSHQRFFVLFASSWTWFATHTHTSDTEIDCQELFSLEITSAPIVIARMQKSAQSTLEMKFYSPISHNLFHIPLRPEPQRNLSVDKHRGEEKIPKLIAHCCV